MKDVEFVTYGFRVEPGLVRRCPADKAPSEREMFVNKPDFGLWGSPSDSEYGWRDWCRDNGFRTGSFSICTRWCLSESARVLKISSFADLESALESYGFRNSVLREMWCLDFRRIAEDYDGVWLTAAGAAECHFERAWRDGWVSLNAWDCESIVVWNADMVKVTETYKEDRNEI